MGINVNNTLPEREISWNQLFLDSSQSFDFETEFPQPVSVTPPVGPDLPFWMVETGDGTLNGSDGTGIDLPEPETSAGPHESIDLPLTNIDPFQSFDPESLPQVTYEDVETGFMYSNTDNAGLRA